MSKARKMLVLALKQADIEMIEAQARAWRCRHLPEPEVSAEAAHDAERLFEMLRQVVNSPYMSDF